MNPFLAVQTLHLDAGDLLPCGVDEDAGLSAVGRPGSTMCSVPLAELHCKGLGPNAEGRSARLGGLASRPDLEGLTCMVLFGPNEKGRYTVQVLLEEEDPTVLLVRPECLTLRIRRGALRELLVDGVAAATGGHRRSRSSSALSAEVVEASAEHCLESRRMVGKSLVASQQARSSPPQHRRSALAQESVPNLAAADCGCSKALATANNSDSASDSSGHHTAVCASTTASRASAAAAAALAAAGQAARDRKFEALDADLASCCVGGSGGEVADGPVAARLPSAQALGLPPQQQAPAPAPSGSGKVNKSRSRRGLKTEKNERRQRQGTAPAELGR